jgi:hypothetical protein
MRLAIATRSICAHRDFLSMLSPACVGGGLIGYIADCFGGGIEFVRGLRVGPTDSYNLPDVRYRNVTGDANGDAGNNEGQSLESTLAVRFLAACNRFLVCALPPNPGVPGKFCTRGSETNWYGRSHEWHEESGIVLSRS